MRGLRTLLAFSLMTMVTATAWGQAWRPDKTVEIITSSAQGGSNDKVARQLQSIMQNERLIGVPVSVVNKPGGNQTLARIYLNQKPGDAHYFEIGNPTLIANHISGLTNLSHRDFTPIALLVSEYTALTVKADSPIRNLADLIALMKKDPEAVSAGISNRGGSNHLTLALTAKAAGIDPRRLKVVVFKSNSESTTALIGGHLQLVSASVPSVIGQVLAGNARVIAVGAPQRMSGALAQVPTIREQGYNVTLDNWRGFIAPKGVGAAQVAYWEDVLARATATAEWKKDLEANHWTNNFLRSREFGRFLDDEYAETRAILTDLGLIK